MLWHKGFVPIHEKPPAHCRLSEWGQKKREWYFRFWYAVLKVSTQQTLLLCDFDFGILIAVGFKNRKNEIEKNKNKGEQ